MPKKIFDLFFWIIIVSILGSFSINTVIDRIQFVRTGIEPTSYLSPIYSPVSVPGTGVGTGLSSLGALGIDFSEVYFGAKAVRFGESAYSPKSAEFQDSLGRLNTNPPFTIWAYIPITFFDYPSALIFQNLGTLLIFIVITTFILIKEDAFQYLWKVLIIYFLLYFFTPIGYTQFERGQFDILAAVACMWPVIVYSSGQTWLVYALIFGIFSSLKWTSIPFIGTFGGFTLFASDSKKRWSIVLTFGIFILIIIIFWSQMMEYFQVLQVMHFNGSLSLGLSFSRILPKPLARTIQVLTALIFMIFFFFFSKENNRQQIFKAVSFPFALVMGIQALGYGMIANEYRTVTLLGLIVPFALWVEKVELPQKFKNITAFLFAIILVFVFRNFNYLQFNIDSRQMGLVYLVTSLEGLLFCFYIIFSMNRETNLSLSGEMALE